MNLKRLEAGRTETRFSRATLQGSHCNAGNEAPPHQDKKIMAKDCASCTNYTRKQDLADYLARACGDAYCGLCRVRVDPTRGAFIRKVESQANCPGWRSEEMPLAA